MAVEIGTATDHTDLLTKLIEFLTVTLADPWTLLSTVGTSRLLHAPGLSGTEEIGVGFDVVGDLGTDAFALIGWMFRDYNPALAHLAQVGYSGRRYHPVWNTGMDYWFIANGQRVIIVTKVSTIYTASYLGKFLPWGAPGEYPQPYYMGMPRATNTRWSSTSEDFRNFFDPGEGGALNLPTSAWIVTSNFFQSSSEQASNTNSHVWPYKAAINSRDSTAVYRLLRENIDGTYNLIPLILCSSTPTKDVYGDLDGAYAIPAFSAASEDIVEIDGDDYLIIQNVFRTQRYYYVALKLE
jgi:hypothetical protein